ncbi:MAG: class I SAM-dependent methyltransferase [Defluviicoccus sp.]|nr:class I SAM-dependent methyltransferase [Defluviicoccus sp.]MDE0275049.1 class I SAM-dependent methyltransferase [Defluviicoccus sp.]
MDEAIYEVFGPLSQGAPGNDASTLRALDAVPGRDAVRQVLDLGAGHGRTTFALAQALPDARITAVEIHPPFVERITDRAREAGLADRVRAICGDMEKIDVAQGSIDLVWAEGSIYLVGVERALATWRPWLRPGGCVAFSDFVRWTGDLSKEARAFWAVEYPDMASEAAIRSRAEDALYRVLSDFRIPKEAHDAYYVPLEARVAELAGRADAAVMRMLEDIRTEIDMVRRFSDEAGYTFFVLQRAEG